MNTKAIVHTRMLGELDHRRPAALADACTTTKINILGPLLCQSLPEWPSSCRIFGRTSTNQWTGSSSMPLLKWCLPFTCFLLKYGGNRTHRFRPESSVFLRTKCTGIIRAYGVAALTKHLSLTDQYGRWCLSVLDQLTPIGMEAWKFMGLLIMFDGRFGFVIFVTFYLRSSPTK